MVKRPTIKDVAKKAGVSIATVSFVLNKHPNEVISEKVKKRVWQAARALEYHPSASAAGLARKRTRNLAIIFYQDESTISNQFYSFVVQGAIKEAMARDYHLLFSFVDGTYRSTKDLPKVVQERNAEGAIFMRQVHPKMIRDIERRGIPVVLIDNFPAVKHANALMIDNRRGGGVAAEYLISQGHRQIAILQGAVDRPSIAERIAGFREALKTAGIPFSPRSQLLACDTLSFDAAHRRALRSFRRSRPFTALFCVNDEMAAGALSAARQVNLAVPGDLSVIGFDDITMSKFTDPKLTTVGVLKEDLGRRAIARLVELLPGGTSSGQSGSTETVDVELVVRDSVARYPAARA